MTTPNCPASVQVCAMRVSRLNPTTGQKISGATNAYVTAAIASIDPKPTYRAGTDLEIPNACGGLVASLKNRDTLKRIDLDVTLKTPDPELEEMLIGSALILGSYGANRTFADGATTSGSAIVTSPALAQFQYADIGRPISGTGIPGGATIISVQSPLQATISTNATATGTGVSITISAVASASLGNTAPRIGVTPSAVVALEAWSRCLLPNGQQDPVTPWWHYVWPLCSFQKGDAALNEASHDQVFHGFTTENQNYLNGPFADFPAAASPLLASQARFRDANIPTASCGYVTVP